MKRKPNIPRQHNRNEQKDRKIKALVTTNRTTAENNTTQTILNRARGNIQQSQQSQQQYGERIKSRETTCNAAKESLMSRAAKQNKKHLTNK